MTSLPEFPVDDVTLDALEHALGAAFTVTDDGEHQLTGADMTVPQLLDFLSGYDEAKAQPLLNEYDQPMPDVTLYPDPVYSRDDVIRALIAEVRRLRCPRPDQAAGHDSQVPEDDEPSTPEQDLARVLARVRQRLQDAAPGAVESLRDLAKNAPQKTIRDQARKTLEDRGYAVDGDETPREQ